MSTEQLFLQLHAKLTRMGFSAWHTMTKEDVFSGCPHTYSLFLKFIWMHYPAVTSRLLHKYDWFIIEQDTVSLGGVTLRLLHLEYNIPTSLSVIQYAKRQYAAAKISMCLQLIKHLGIDNQSIHRATRANKVVCSHKSSRNASEDVVAAENLILDHRRKELNSLVRL